MNSVEAATQCIQQLSGKQFQGSHLRLLVNIAENKTQKPQQDTNTVQVFQCANVRYGNNKKLFVGRLPYVFGRQEISDLFSPFGAIEEIRLFVDTATGVSKGAAFVRFLNEESATKAMLALNNQIPFGNEMWGALRVTVANR